ncbi:MAG: VOC family protein [Solirubrobacteraceae bacterium]
MAGPEQNAGRISMLERLSRDESDGRIPPETTIGCVNLTVTDAVRSQHFYAKLMGLEPTRAADGSLSLAPAGGGALLRLVANASALARDHRQTGLFHVAILVPSRRELAAALVRLTQGGWRLDGAADHLVSEAVYLQDPDGNGIEIYRDRKPDQWIRGERGQIKMATLPLDLDDLVSELRSVPLDEVNDTVMPAGTRIGHIHLQVASIPAAERFYDSVLGFDITERGYPGALFVSAGGYHHHIGLNVWNSRGAAAPPPGSVGLNSFELKLGDQHALAAVRDRLTQDGVDMTDPPTGNGVLVQDPSGNRIQVTV